MAAWKGLSEKVERCTIIWDFLDSSSGKEYTCNSGDSGSIPGLGSAPGEPTPVFLGFYSGSDGKESTCNVGDLGSIPRLGKSPGGRHGNPLNYSCLKNPHGQRSGLQSRGLQSMRPQRVGHDWVTKHSILLYRQEREEVFPDFMELNGLASI